MGEAEGGLAESVGGGWGKSLGGALAEPVVGSVGYLLGCFPASGDVGSCGLAIESGRSLMEDILLRVATWVITAVGARERSLRWGTSERRQTDTLQAKHTVMMGKCAGF